MELIIFLILIVIFAARKTSENTQGRINRETYEEKERKREEARKKFDEISYDPFFQDECLDAVDEKGERYQTLYNVILYQTGHKPPDQLVYMGLMAEKCKIPDKVARSGISKPLFVPNERHRDRIAKVEMCHAHMKWYDQYLRAHGFPFKLYYLTGQSGNFKYVDLENVTQEQLLSNGEYGWKEKQSLLLNCGVRLY